NIRFLFGFPFSILFFAVVIAVSGDKVPWPVASFWPWLLLGALSQIVGTGMMLLAMEDRSFVVTTAYLKTEAIQTAIFGFVFFGLVVQRLVLPIYLLARAPDVLKAILGLWKPSMLAGFMGAFASQFWFLAFALTAAANVRTLALVEVLFAQGVAYYSFKQPL